MHSPAISTVAFVGAFAMLGLFIFNVLPANKALMIGGGLVVIGYVTQPPITT